MLNFYYLFGAYILTDLIILTVEVFFICVLSG